jgi:hypothetical protein
MAGVKAGVARPAVAGEALCRARTTPARLMQGQASRPTSCIASALLGGSLRWVEGGAWGLWVHGGWGLGEG